MDESLACSRRAPVAASGSTRHTGLRLPEVSKSIMHGVRHWQPLMETGHVGQSAGAAVGVGLGVADLEGEEETGMAVGVGALDRETGGEIVGEAEAEAEALGRESWVARSEGGAESVLLAEETVLRVDENVGCEEKEGEGTVVGVGALDREPLEDKVGRG